MTMTEPFWILNVVPCLLIFTVSTLSAINGKLILLVLRCRLSYLQRRRRGIPGDTDGGNHPLHVFVYDFESCLRKQKKSPEKEICILQSETHYLEISPQAVGIDRQKLDQFHNITSETFSEKTF